MVTSSKKNTSIAFFCQWNGNFDFHIGAECFRIYARVGDEYSYDITITREDEEDDEVEEYINVLFEHQFPLTEKEWEEACWHSLHDFMLFDDTLEELVCKRVAKDLFSFLMLALERGEEFEDTIMDDSYLKEWENYYKSLLHERMARCCRSSGEDDSGSVLFGKY